MSNKDEVKQLVEKMLEEPKTKEVKEEITFWRQVLSYLNFIKTRTRKENANKQWNRKANRKR